MSDQTIKLDRHDLITPVKLRAWDACWSDDRIAEHFAGRTALTAREIADDESIRYTHRMWVLTNALARKDIWLTYDLALWCAEQALAKLTPEWQAKLAPVFDQVRTLRGPPHAEAAARDADAAGQAAWAAEAAARAAETAEAAARDADAAGAAARAAEGAWAAEAAARAAARAAYAAGAAEGAWASEGAWAAADAAVWAGSGAADFDAVRGRLLNMLES